MARYLLGVDFQPGVIDTPMEEWKPEEIDAHFDYYRALNAELTASVSWYRPRFSPGLTWRRS
jgi:hypothetical protein